MNRRDSLNGGLRRRKSTVSRGTNPVLPMLSEAEERDAQIAATHAFEQGNRRRAMTHVSPFLWDERTDRPELRGPDAEQHGTPQRGSLAGSWLWQHSRDQPLDHEVVENIPGDREVPQQTPRSADQRGPHATDNASEITTSASASGMASAAQGVAGDLIPIIMQEQEALTDLDNIASVPSSFSRKPLRRAQSTMSGSMKHIRSVNTGLVASSTATQQTSLGVRPTNTESLAGNENSHPRMKSHHSMSVLPKLRKKFGSLSLNPQSTSSQGEKVVPLQPSCPQSVTRNPQLSQSTHDTELQPEKRLPENHEKKRKRLGSNPSIMASGLKKTMRRTTSNKLPGNLRNQARKISQGVKDTLKGLMSFNVAKSDMGSADQAASIPAQHVEARRSHGTSMINTGDGLQAGTDSVLFNDQSSISRVTSGVPSVHNVPAHQQPQSQQGSMESCRSGSLQSRERSRVTSWSNSDANTLGSGYGECQPRSPLSTLDERGKDNPSSKADNTENPSMKQSNGHCGQRLYSALVRRGIRSVNNQGNECNSTRNANAQGSVQFIQKPPYEVWGSPQKPTIRCVTPANSVTLQKDDSFHKTTSNPFHTTSVSIERPPLGYKAVSARCSPYFASPIGPTFRGQSEYRQKLRDQMKEADDENLAKSPEFNPWGSIPNLHLVTKRTSSCGSIPDCKIQYDESIYSPYPEDLTVGSLNAALHRRPPSTHGSATIFLDTPVPKTSVTMKPRISSSSSSIEWKTWLSHNVSKLEQTASIDKIAQLSDCTPFATSSRHVREHAQTDDDDDERTMEDFPRPFDARDIGSSGCVFPAATHLEIEKMGEHPQRNPFYVLQSNPATKITRTQIMTPLGNRVSSSAVVRIKPSKLEGVASTKAENVSPDNESCRHYLADNDDGSVFL
ncbi:hypothetical protein F5Y18DRAFT_440343 [Xylariaceae sp. FL1019]|nr:hypothetical protein F5Y18DRAFT_440343 [Xylariaceae sp. FL1019]